MNNIFTGWSKKSLKTFSLDCFINLYDPPVLLPINLRKYILKNITLFSISLCKMITINPLFVIFLAIVSNLEQIFFFCFDFSDGDPDPPDPWPLR